MRMTESHRVVHGFQYKLATCKCQELHGPQKQPGGHMHGRNRKDGEKEKRTNLRASQRQTRNICIGRADFDFFVRFENTASCIIRSTTCWRKPTPSVCLRCRALTGAYLLCCLLRGLTALCRTVLCLRCLRYGGGSRY